VGFILQLRRPAACLAAVSLATALSGCGGGSGSMTAPTVSVSVSLVNPKVVVTQGGAPVVVQIEIESTSETALVAVTGLPGGVKENYAASDTNPSGTLTFKASTSATLGTYSPKVTVNSAGQTASTTFTLVVDAKP
jgi:hypothetical protein